MKNLTSTLLIGFFAFFSDAHGNLTIIYPEASMDKKDAWIINRDTDEYDVVPSEPFFLNDQEDHTFDIGGIDVFFDAERLLIALLEDYREDVPFECQIDGYYKIDDFHDYEYLKDFAIDIMMAEADGRNITEEQQEWLSNLTHIGRLIRYPSIDCLSLQDHQKTYNPLRMSISKNKPVEQATKPQRVIFDQAPGIQTAINPPLSVSGQDNFQTNTISLDLTKPDITFKEEAVYLYQIGQQNQVWLIKIGPNVHTGYCLESIYTVSLNDFRDISIQVDRLNERKEEDGEDSIAEDFQRLLETIRSKGNLISNPEKSNVPCNLSYDSNQLQSDTLTMLKVWP